MVKIILSSYLEDPYSQTLHKYCQKIMLSYKETFQTNILAVFIGGLCFFFIFTPKPGQDQKLKFK